jgi:hypothetical protein
MTAPGPAFRGTPTMGMATHEIQRRLEHPGNKNATRHLKVKPTNFTVIMEQR